MNEVQYFGNFMDDAVVKTTDNPDVRIVKSITPLKNQIRIYEAGTNSKFAFGGESCAFYHILETISEEEYNTFGITWIFGEKESEHVHIDKPLDIEKLFVSLRAENSNTFSYAAACAPAGQ